MLCVRVCAWKRSAWRLGKAWPCSLVFIPACDKEVGCQMKQQIQNPVFLLLDKIVLHLDRPRHKFFLEDPYSFWHLCVIIWWHLSLYAIVLTGPNERENYPRCCSLTQKFCVTFDAVSKRTRCTLQQTNTSNTQLICLTWPFQCLAQSHFSR